MTRLVENDICSIERELNKYDEGLRMMMGCGLSEIAAAAVGCSEEAVRLAKVNYRVAAVPMRSGDGIIGGFSASVCAIARGLGFYADAYEEPDVLGISKACKSRAEIIMLADDDYFRAMEFKSGAVADNSICTGEGYSAALDILSGGVAGKCVLIVGTGQVGCAAAEWLVQKGANLTLYNRSRGKADILRDRIKDVYGAEVQVTDDIEAALRDHSLIMDASSIPSFIREEHIKPDTYISAPGMPLGLTPEAADKARGRLVHDPLQLGTAVMLYSIIKQCENL